MFPDSQIKHIDFNRFMMNPKNTVREILEFAEVDCDDASTLAINHFLEKHTRDRHGRIDYNFEDLGLQEGEIRERFSFYQASSFFD